MSSRCTAHVRARGHATETAALCATRRVGACNHAGGTRPPGLLHFRRDRRPRTRADRLRQIELAPPPGLALGHLHAAQLRDVQAAALAILGRAGRDRAQWRDRSRGSPTHGSIARRLLAPLQQGLLLLQFAPWPLLPKLAPFSTLTDPARTHRRGPRRVDDGLEARAVRRLEEPRLSDFLFGAAEPCDLALSGPLRRRRGRHRGRDALRRRGLMRQWRTRPFHRNTLHRNILQRNRAGDA